MSYIVKRIDEDLDFGCEERAEDAMLYERNINEGDKVYFDKDNKLEKVLDEK